MSDNDQLQQIAHLRREYTKGGQPYQRIVLLKHYDEKGLVFYTNLGSRKAHQIEHNPRISLLFPWHMLERQVMVTGKAERLSTLEVVRSAHGSLNNPAAFPRAVSSKANSWSSSRSFNRAKCRYPAFGVVFA